MESAGLLARREQKSDRRSLAISLTADGRRMFARILPLTLAETDRALTGFPADERAALRAQLRRMADNLKAT
jgi:DNA-binding MarR family transcriptional regulator